MTSPSFLSIQDGTSTFQSFVVTTAWGFNKFAAADRLPAAGIRIRTSGKAKS